MAGSSKQQPLSSKLSLWPPPRTPGPLGRNDQGDPDLTTLLGDTPGPLGLLDLADPTLLFSSSASTIAFLGGNLLACSLQDAGTNQPKDKMDTITVGQLDAIFPDADDDYLGQVAAELNTDLPKYGLDTVLRRAHFFAQVRQEAGAGLEAQVESFEYSPSALITTFGYYKKHKDEAEQDGYAKDPKTGKKTRHANQDVIANKVYGGRTDLGNGDAASGDGWQFRGRGFIQVTGRDNYTSLAAHYKSIYGGGADFVTNPDLVASFPYSVRSAVCFWVSHGLPRLADHGSTNADVDAITAVINASTTSYGDRQTNFKAALKAFQ